LKKTNITAYNIDGVMYFRRGKYSGKKKKKILAQIANGENPIQWEIEQENKTSAFRRKTQKASNRNSAKHETKKEIIGDLISWLQT
tara:strand:- start:115 stop:372 length:258 start_codon:yes stop_codon:yes gene_type:complete